MKIKRLHIISVLTLLMWSFFSVHTILFNKSERIAKQKLIFLTLCFSIAISFAQQFTNYSIKDGLPSNHIYTIRQDAKGFIWFLTDKGMVRYNGKEFKTFTTKNGLPKNDIWEANTTTDGKVWYMSKTTELGYIENDTVISFPNETKDEIMNPLFTSQIGNDIYPTGPRKTYKLEKGKWKITYQYNYGGNIKEYPQKLYHSTIGFHYINNTSDSIAVHNKKNEYLKSFAFNGPIHPSAKRKQLNDSLFIWYSSKKFMVLNLNSLNLTQHTIKDEIGLETAEHLRINTVNNKIQISGTGFVGFLDEQFHIKNTYFFPKEIKSHFALIDKNNNIWFATSSNGVYKLPAAKKLNKYVLKNLKTKEFNWVDSTLYTSVAGKGFYKYNSKSHNFNLFLKTSNYPFSTVKTDSINSQFFLLQNDFIYYKNNQFNSINLSGISNIYSKDDLSQLIYFNKAFYAISYFSIIKLDTQNFKFEKEFIVSGVNKLFKFNNRLLVATNYGLKEIKNDSLLDITFKDKTLTKSIISINKISSNKLILGTDGFGAFITNLDTIHQLPKSEYLTIEGVFIEKNTIWLATNEGIYVYKKDKSSYIFNRKIDSSDGLPSNNVNDVVIKNNEILASTNNGIVILPRQIKNQSQFSNIYFDKVVYNKSNITYKNQTQKYSSNNNINFKIASIDYSEGNSKFTYQYKLEPIQNKWITTTSKNLTFGELEPNKYNLSIKHKTINQNFEFKITPLWYQRTLAKVFFVFLGLTAFGVLLLKVRSRELTKRTNKINTQKKLAEYELHALRSQMNPHFVFNSLNSIQYYINKNEIELSEKYLVKFSRLIRKFFDFSRAKFINLEQEISLLENYLEIEKMRFGNEFYYEFKVDEKLKLKNLKIPSMLLQPIVENAVNHGLFHNEGKGTITLIFKYISANEYSVEVLDNGVGLKKAKEIKEKSIKTHISKSSEIIKDRIYLLNQSHKWHTTYLIKELENEKGTNVKLTFRNNE